MLGWTGNTGKWVSIEGKPTVIILVTPKTFTKFLAQITRNSRIAK